MHLAPDGETMSPTPWSELRSRKASDPKLAPCFQISPQYGYFWINDNDLRASFFVFAAVARIPGEILYKAVVPGAALD